MIPKGLKSTKSTVKSFVVFENKTSRIVHIFWLNYEGRPVPYSILQPNTTYLVNTYISHPWIIKDRDTGELMHVDHKEVFWPPPWFKHINQATRTTVRATVVIHFPIRTLKLNTLWIMVKQLDHFKKIDKLELPHTLQDDLKEIYQLAYNHRNVETS
jgi:von Hippel-Lindau disease tumor supressor